MENTNTLDILLQVEAKAAALVKDAQEEADRRIRECEEQNSKTYEERTRAEFQTQENSLEVYREKVKNDYKNELDIYRQELTKINADKERFSELINEYLAKG